jgi:hypothetical protein
MTQQISDTILGAIKIAGLPEEACFTTFKDLLQALPNYLQVEIPTSVTNVLVSSTTPNEDQRDYLWVRRDLNGRFIGLYTYQCGKWQPAYNFAPGQIIWIYSSTGDVPDGFQKVDASNSAVPVAVANALAATYIKNSSNVDVYFAVTYVGCTT